uniref:hypothetical protein n=1 Tax=Stenotrophomonas maltophilia TaxID=40324 RepID=UPI0019549346
GYGPWAGKILAAIIAAHHAGLADGVDLERRMEAAKGLVPGGWKGQAGPLPAPEDCRPTRAFDPRGGPKGFAASFL